jgi:hypothetical protein
MDEHGRPARPRPCHLVAYRVPKETHSRSRGFPISSGFQDAEVATFRAIGQQVGLLLLARTADVPPTLDTPGSSPSPPG